MRAVRGMRFLKTIRELRALNPWAMSKAMGKPIQSYQSLEKATSRIALKDLIRAYEVSELPLDKFWNLIVEEVRGEDTKKEKRSRK